MYIVDMVHFEFECFNHINIFCCCCFVWWSNGLENWQLHPQLCVPVICGIYHPWLCYTIFCLQQFAQFRNVGNFIFWWISRLRSGGRCKIGFGDFLLNKSETRMIASLFFSPYCRDGILLFVLFGAQSIYP